MNAPILDIADLTELIFTVITIVLLLSSYILVSYKKIKKGFIVFLFVSIVASTHMLVLCDDFFRITIQLSLDQSIHMGLFLGLPAILFLTLGALLVLFNEKKYVLHHGYFAGSLDNYIDKYNSFNCFNSSDDTGLFMIDSFNPIIFGGFGMVTGFTSMLFGIATRRHIAKLTGYITRVFWWGAFLLSLYIPSI